MTDYRGARLDDIIAGLKDWADRARQDVAVLANVGWRLAKLPSTSETLDGIRFVAVQEERFTRIADELDRLVVDLHEVVLPSHVEALRQLFSMAVEIDDRCVSLKRTWRLGEGDQEDCQLLLELYQRARDAALDLFDLSNVAHRLEALVRSNDLQEEALPALELRPNVAGLGLNLNYLLGRLARWWRFRRPS